MTGRIEITLFTKSGGPLTKQIALDVKTGAVISDGSACVMTAGSAQSVPLSSMADFATVISALTPDQAIALGALRDELPNEVQITTKTRLNGSARPDLIARTADNIVFRPGHPALALCDFDLKGMPPAVVARIEALGGFDAALASVLPELSRAARLTRGSTSAGLYRTDTGERLPESGGQHLYVVAQDGSDIDRFLKMLHARCWLAGLGWMMVGAGGQLLERSIVDRVVGAPERLVFEGPPVLAPPLGQDAERRRPRPLAGETIDTPAACPDLTATEEAQLQELRASETARLGLEVRAARTAFVDKQAKRIVERTGMSPEAAARVVEQQCDGTLLSAVELHFDDPELAGKTVGDVLADPDSYVGETLADPLEGVEYGRNKAKILRRSNGSLLIHSFAHGRTVYNLKDDGAGASTTITVTAGERHLAADAGIAALRVAGTAFYQRDKSLVRVCEVKARSSAGDIILVPGIVAVTPAILERTLGQTAQWERYDIKKKGMVRTDPPRPVISQIMDMAGEWPFPPLAGVIGCPTLGPGGSLLSREGYDLATGLVLISAVIMPRLSDCPTREEAEAAAALLGSLLDEFPFATPVDRAVAMSMLVTPVLRGAMAVAPIHLTIAAEAGTGKSYLADVSSTIATGEKAAAVAVAPNPEETEKRLVGAALAGHPIISLDNCRETLEGDFLCQVSERPLLQLRALGKSDPVRVANTFSVFANGSKSQTTPFAVPSVAHSTPMSRSPKTGSSPVTQSPPCGRLAAPTSPRASPSPAPISRPASPIACRRWPATKDGRIWSARRWCGSAMTTRSNQWPPPAAPILSARTGRACSMRGAPKSVLAPRTPTRCPRSSSTPKRPKSVNSCGLASPGCWPKSPRSAAAWLGRSSRAASASG